MSRITPADRGTGSRRSGIDVGSERLPRWLTWLAGGVLWVLAGTVAAKGLIVLGDDSAAYRQVADELQTGLASAPGLDGGMDRTTVARLADAGGSVLGGYQVVVTVGLAAAKLAIPHGTAVADPPVTLCLLIPRQSFEELVSARSARRDGRLSALYIDQPLSRQMDLLRLALPDKRRVGVILGPSSSRLGDELRVTALQRGLSLSVAEVAEPSDVYGALQRIMPGSDLLLMVPDPVATDPDTVYGLMLTSYRAQIPLVGFSEGLVKSGALISLYSTAQQQGREGAEIVRRFLAEGGSLPAPNHPGYFTVRVNQSVARSLGLQMEEGAELAKALDQLGADAVEPVDARPGDAGGQPRGRP